MIVEENSIELERSFEEFYRKMKTNEDYTYFNVLSVDINTVHNCFISIL